MRTLLQTLNAFPLMGTLANVAGVLLGATAGLLLKKGLNKKLCDLLMLPLGAFTLYVGLSSVLDGQNALAVAVSLILGGLLGHLLDLDGLLQRLGDWVQKKLGGKTGQRSLAEGFVTASLLFCVGSMTVVGSLQSGIAGDHTLLYTKTVMDTVAAVLLASQLGVGVHCSAAFVLVYQGGLTLLAMGLGNFLSDAAVAQMTCAGGVLIMALALDLLGIAKLKVMNYMPALIFAPLLTLIL